MEKLETHQLGLLHRAFSVFIFNSKGELLMQQRADVKYHSPGLWTNTCCSHPEFGEELNDAVVRRLREEMGLNIIPEFAFSFVYKAEFSNGLTEHEFDHVFFGISDIFPEPEAEEVKNWKYMGLNELRSDLELNPEHYTEWLKICFNQVTGHFKIFQEKLMARTNPNLNT